MPAALPRFALLGAPLPDATRAALLDTVELVGSFDAPDLEGALAPATAEILPHLRRYRYGGGRLPVFAIAEAPVDIAERLRWIREGADDLLEARGAAAALAKKLRSEGWRSTPANGAPIAGDRVDRWLRASARYLDTREELVGELGAHGRSRFLDTSFLRDQVLRASEGEGAPDPFGQRRGSDREPLDWPVQLLAPVPSQGRLLNIGADGACLALPAAPGPGERIHLSVAGENVAARMELEVRWQRRAGRDRWQVGAFSIACAIEGVQDTSG